jgi:hypothetical protein
MMGAHVSGETKGGLDVLCVASRPDESARLIRAESNGRYVREH